MPNEGKLTIETANANLDDNYVQERPINAFLQKPFTL
jgi:hypothetical protein